MGSQAVAWSIEQLLEAVAALPAQRLLGVDGLTLSGKTWVAERIAREFGWSHLDGDDFIRDGTRPHPQALDLVALKQRVDEAPVPIVLSTIMLQSVCEAIACPGPSTVYVRRRNPDLSFARPEFYEDFQPDHILADVAEFCGLFGYGPDEPIFDQQFVHYRVRYNPLSNAAVLFENVFAGS